jgi:hypothetical protein
MMSVIGVSVIILCVIMQCDGMLGASMLSVIILSIIVLFIVTPFLIVSAKRVMPFGGVESTQKNLFTYHLEDPSAVEAAGSGLALAINFSIEVGRGKSERE